MMLPHAVVPLTPMPSDDVAIRLYPPKALPTNNCPYVGAVEVPVPPLPIGRIPVMSLARLTSPEVIAPAVARTMPVSVPSVIFDAKKLLVDATPLLVTVNNDVPEKSRTSKRCTACPNTPRTTSGIAVEDVASTVSAAFPAGVVVPISDCPVPLTAPATCEKAVEEIC